MTIKDKSNLKFKPFDHSKWKRPPMSYADIPPSTYYRRYSMERNMEGWPFPIKIIFRIIFWIRMPMMKIERIYKLLLYKIDNKEIEVYKPLLLLNTMRQNIKSLVEKFTTAKPKKLKTANSSTAGHPAYEGIAN